MDECVALTGTDRLAPTPATPLVPPTDQEVGGSNPFGRTAGEGP